MGNKVLVLGRGFLGKAFEREYFHVLGRNEFEFVRGCINLDLHKLKKYDVIVNCVGKSNTRWCESPANSREALYSNGEVPKILSEFCRQEGKQFVHISTGCLYDDTSRQQSETDFVAAHCRYTVTKWIGEMGCNPEKDLIIRPRLLFGDFPDRNNQLCKLPKFERHLTVPNSYTSVHVIVHAVQALLEEGQTGIFNVACDCSASVKDLAQWCGLPSRETISERELHRQQELYLVSNVMELSKLRKLYQPPKLEDEVMRCWESLRGGKCAA